MQEKGEKQKIRKLKEMIQDKEDDETVEQVLVKFCARSGVSLNTCRNYYQNLVESGEIKKES
jgi:hypothetical protein